MRMSNSRASRELYVGWEYQWPSAVAGFIPLCDNSFWAFRIALAWRFALERGPL